MLQAVDPIWHLWHFSLTNPRRQPGLPLEHLDTVMVYECLYVGIQRRGIGTTININKKNVGTGMYYDVQDEVEKEGKQS